MRKLTSNTIAAIAVGAVAVTGTGVAYAYWTTTGSGEGSATTHAADTAQLQVNQLAQPAASDLAPGLAGGTLSGDVENIGAAGAPNYAATGVTITLSVEKASGAVGDCDASDYLIVSANETAAYAVTAGVGSITTTLNAAGTAVDLAPQATAAWSSTLSFVNKATNQDGCMGATVDLSYVTVQS